MSFIFEDFWGVVVRDSAGRVEGIRALGGWDHMITATHVTDIAQANADLTFTDTQLRNQAVYIAGATIRYDEFADLVEKVAGRPIKREVWTTEYLNEQSKTNPDDKLLKYRVVFSEDKGLSWPKADTYHEKQTEWDFEAYMRKCNVV